MITPYTTLAEIKQNEVCRRLFRYFIFEASGTGAGNLTDDRATLADIENKTKTWSAADMAYGLNALTEQASHQVDYAVYSDAEIAQSPDKADVKLFYFKATEQTKQNKTVILAAGGAYGAVCSLVEAFPVAADFAAMGIDAFCLNYRVGAPAPLFPKPMDDMAAAVKFLLENADTVGINMKNYAVGGFSAGGHLASCYGTKQIGYARYGLPRPTLLILGYPMTDIWGNVNPAPEPLRSMMLGGYFGEKYTKETADGYKAAALCDGDCPPCFITQAKDDTTVPIVLTEQFAAALTEKGVPVEFLKSENGSHGYGRGTACAASGWPKRAADFWRATDERN